MGKRIIFKVAGILTACAILLFTVRFIFYLSYSENERLILKIKMIEKENSISKLFGYLTKFEKTFFVVADVGSPSNICLKYILDERYNSALDYYYLKIKNKPTQGFLKAPTHIRMIQNDTVSVNFDNYMNSIIDFSLFKAYIKEKDLSNKDSIIETYVHFLKYDPMLNIDRTAQKQHQLNYDIDVLQLPYDMAVENIDRNCRLQQTSIDFITYKRIKSIEDIYQVTSAYPELYKELEKIDIDFQNRIDWFFNWGLLSIDCQFNDGELISVDVKVLYSSESAYLYLLTHSEKEQNEIIREDNE